MTFTTALAVSSSSQIQMAAKIRRAIMRDTTNAIKDVAVRITDSSVVVLAGRCDAYFLLAKAINSTKRVIEEEGESYRISAQISVVYRDKARALADQTDQTPCIIGT